MGRKLSDALGPRELLTTEEIARLLHVTRVTVHRWLVAGKLEFTKTAGGHRRITREELVRFTREVGIETPPELVPDRGPARLLLVDDDANLASSLKRVLEQQARGRLSVSVEADGFSALLRAVDEKPEAILLDGILRGMDGVQACKTLKTNPKTKHIVIIAISGLQALEVPFRQAGADTFLAKPFEAKDVFDVLEALQVMTRQAAV